MGEGGGRQTDIDEHRQRGTQWAKAKETHRKEDKTNREEETAIERVQVKNTDTSNTIKDNDT